MLRGSAQVLLLVPERRRTIARVCAQEFSSYVPGSKEPYFNMRELDKLTFYSYYFA